MAIVGTVVRGLGAVSLLLLLLLLGCGHLAPEEIEAAGHQQALARTDRCPDGDRPCCARQVSEARNGATVGATARAAHLWHAVALSCPERRDQAAAAITGGASSPATSAVTAPAPPPRTLNVGHRVRLPSSYRLYWLAAAAGERLLPSAGPWPAVPPTEIAVEVQAQDFDGNRGGPVVRVQRRFPLPADPGATITIEIAEGGASTPIDLRAETQAPPPASARPASRRPRDQGPPPQLQKASILRLDPPRTPVEFGDGLRGARPALRICLDRHGELESARLLAPVHPRLLAVHLDALRAARFAPYRVNDQGVPSCETLAALLGE